MSRRVLLGALHFVDGTRPPVHYGTKPDVKTYWHQLQTLHFWSNSPKCVKGYEQCYYSPEWQVRYKEEAIYLEYSWHIIFGAPAVLPRGSYGS